ncbi:PIG-L family deacetylase [Chamaesiphon sp. VAR_69_metabat_338]|uniref:PIG-L deacetylase family protein n=1 Tax=Chamaesiphon sp. VAR_69_metabat_338 TaxID=2964704 RepID=UPI00286E28BE|nr:PIG-L family deacetylase [Chamaesiphon sp. VAR_69_metabat_338]
MNLPRNFNDRPTEESGRDDSLDDPYPLGRWSTKLSPLSPVAGESANASSQILLARPETLPLLDLSAVSRQRAVVVAPHPDDETLGCGGAIALMCAKGYDVKVAIVSDGTGSHPNSQTYLAPALRSLRELETLAALKILGIEDRSRVTFLGLQDGAVPTLAAPTFLAAKLRCQRYLRQTLPDTIFLPWRADPHPDHRATWQLFQAAILSLGISPQIIEYPIWDWDVQQQKKLPDLDRISGWRLDIERVLATKKQAIATYKSQLGELIDDDPDGFYLTPELLTNFTRPWEVYFEEI